MLSRLLSVSTITHGFRFVVHFFRRLWWITRQLWHEIIGTLFLLLTLGFSQGAFRMWQDKTPGRATIAGLSAAMMLYFAVTSFLRARHIHRKEEPQ